MEPVAAGALRGGAEARGEIGGLALAPHVEPQDGGPEGLAARVDGEQRGGLARHADGSDGIAPDGGHEALQHVAREDPPRVGVGLRPARRGHVVARPHLGDGEALALGIEGRALHRRRAEVHTDEDAPRHDGRDYTGGDIAPLRQTPMRADKSGS